MRQMGYPLVLKHPPLHTVNYLIRALLFSWQSRASGLQTVRHQSKTVSVLLVSLEVFLIRDPQQSGGSEYMCGPIHLREEKETPAMGTEIT